MKETKPTHQRFFINNNNYDNVFIPWGIGGEGYALNKNQGEIARLFIKVFLALVVIVLSVCVLSIGFALQTFLELYWLLAIVTTFMLTFYVAGTLFIVRNTTPNSKAIEPNDKKISRMAKELLQLTVGLISLFIISYLYVPSTWTMVAGIFCIIFYPLITLLFIKKAKCISMR